MESRPRIRTIDDAIEAFVESRYIAGAVTLIADERQILHLSAVGHADIEQDRPMETDAIFHIASMTKPVTAAAILMLQDQQKLSIHDPVAKFIPEFASLKTPSGKAANLTLLQCLTHTSGLSEASNEQLTAARTLQDLIPAFLSKPTMHEPGSKWVYSQSSINTLGRIVELLTDKPLEEALQAMLFQPLGMRDTTFYLRPEQLSRLTAAYRSESGKLTPEARILLHGHEPTSRNRYPAANGGLFSTASDYLRFAQMLLSDGTLDGRQYLKLETVRLMRSNHTGNLAVGFVPGSVWGLGVGVVDQPMGATESLSRGTFGHGGYFGTQAWIDPTTRRVHILMVQSTNMGNTDGTELRRAFHNAAAGV